MILFSHQVNKVSGNWRSSGNHHMGIRDLQSRPSGQYLRNSQILLFLTGRMFWMGVMTDARDIRICAEGIWLERDVALTMKGDNYGIQK